MKYLTIEKGRRCRIGNYPSFHKSGSVKGMRKFYGGKAIFVRCGYYICNVSSNPAILNLAK